MRALQSLYCECLPWESRLVSIRPVFAGVVGGPRREERNRPGFLRSFV